MTSSVISSRGPRARAVVAALFESRSIWRLLGGSAPNLAGRRERTCHFAPRPAPRACRTRRRASCSAAGADRRLSRLRPAPPARPAAGRRHCALPALRRPAAQAHAQRLRAHARARARGRDPVRGRQRLSVPLLRDARARHADERRDRHRGPVEGRQAGDRRARGAHDRGGARRAALAAALRARPRAHRPRSARPAHRVPAAPARDVVEHDRGLHAGHHRRHPEADGHGDDRARSRAVVVRAADARAVGGDGGVRPGRSLGTRRGTPVSAPAATALGASCASCHDCGLLSRVDGRAHGARCPRCGAALHFRKPRSLERTWAFLIAAMVCYVPANLFPVMTVISLGKAQSDTILSGAIYLLMHGMWPLALIIFVASVFVPLMKIAILAFLLVSVQRRSAWRPAERTRLYRLTEAIGRWSMVDIYVVTILVALVRLGNLATIEAGLGAVFFGAVVVLTIFAAESFDPRLVWDTSQGRQT
ncbi:MAG: hypothetical protein DCC71_14820 [Proteobacteria bacterium]|nr:MAG: hypothetical protein DCC71_14820 [Pseudomonadota bacterium]